MTAAIQAVVAILASQEFRTAFVANLETVRGANLMVYSTRLYIPNQGYRDYNTIAWRHGGCPAKKKKNIMSDVTIVRKGKPVRMRYCRNKQLMPLAQYLQMRAQVTKTPTILMD